LGLGSSTGYGTEPMHVIFGGHAGELVCCVAELVSEDGLVAGAEPGSAPSDSSGAGGHAWDDVLHLEWSEGGCETVVLVSRAANCGSAKMSSMDITGATAACTASKAWITSSASSRAIQAPIASSSSSWCSRRPAWLRILQKTQSTTNLGVQLSGIAREVPSRPEDPSVKNFYLASSEGIIASVAPTSHLSRRWIEANWNF
jgi:hypothetical protein